VDRVDDGDGPGRWGRLRWRRRGAWLWPAFVIATLLEMVLLHELPVEGDTTGWVGAMLAAGCLNLIAVALVSRVGGALLRRRRSDLPRVVAEDYAGSAALAIVAACFVVAGVVHRSAISEHRAAFDEQLLVVHSWVTEHGDAFANEHLSLADTVVVDTDLFRTCVPTPDPKRSLCLVVDTKRSPPTVKLDPNHEPNARFSPRGGFR
jgi:hypothetical protein